MPTSNVDIAGETRGYLTAVRPAGRSTRRGIIWVIRCRCGTKLEMPAAEFRRSKQGKLFVPRSCGCYRKEHRSHLYKGVGDLSSCRWRQILASANRKGLQFTISQAYAWHLYVRQGKRCALSGVSLVMNPTSLAAGANTASLDRKDNTKGYVRGNVQWVHLTLNYMKSDMQQAEFVSWCSRVAKGKSRNG